MKTEKTINLTAYVVEVNTTFTSTILVIVKMKLNQKVVLLLICNYRWYSWL